VKPSLRHLDPQSLAPVQGGTGPLFGPAPPRPWINPSILLALSSLTIVTFPSGPGGLPPGR
jgi:hypothetical protein